MVRFRKPAGRTSRAAARGLLRFNPLAGWTDAEVGVSEGAALLAA